ncbi:MAG: conjugal transfer protein TraF [Erysipelotrichaceae bacterium]|nr:conjugal transfer protein TraF [Erysipelotrichaceae bacterium]
MKKILTVLLALTLLLMTGCQSGRMARKDPQKIMKLFEQKQAFVLFIERADCETCKAQSEVMSRTAKEKGIDINYIVVTDEMVEDDDMNFLINNYLYYLEVTPSTYLINNGRVIDMKEGFIEYDEMVNWLAGYGYIEG